MAGQKWLAGVALLLLALKSSCKPNGETAVSDDGITISLPKPRYDSSTSAEEAILRRRSVRDYAGGALTLEELAQLLWAAQGITDPRGYRAAPSAGATYPLEIYAVVGDVAGVAGGIYHYEPEKHQLLKVIDGDKRKALAEAALDQRFVVQAPANLVITAIYDRTTGHYDQRGVRYVDMEAGHAAQNIYLQAVALNLGTVVIGAFDDSRVAEILKLADNEVPLYIMPVGRITD